MLKANRIFISLAAVIAPIFLLLGGIYGSFLFTFSIPILWQTCITNQSFQSLGFKKTKIKASILWGIVSGIGLGLLGGNILKLAGMTGYSFSDITSLKINLSIIQFDFPLNKELGYYLLTKSNTLSGASLYLAFSICLIGLGEELFWRGFIQDKIAKFQALKKYAIWVTAAIFALSHFYIFTILSLKLGIFFLGIVMLGGLVWGYLFKLFGNVYIIAISHGITAFILWKYYFFAAG